MYENKQPDVKAGRHTSLDSGRAPRSRRRELVCVWERNPVTRRPQIVRWERLNVD